MAQISFNLLFDWDNSGAFNFNESNYLELASGDESMSPPGESSFSGSGFVSEMNLDLINTDSRFSTTNSSSSIYNYIRDGAFLQKRVRLEVIIDGVTYTIFRGFIKSISETLKDYKSIGKVRIKCRSQDDIIKNMQISTPAATTRLAIKEQYDESTLISLILSNAGLTNGVHFRNQDYVLITPTLDRGLFTIPYFWLEKESPIEDAWLLAAACGGRFYFNSEDGLFYYKNAYGFGKGKSATSQATINESNCSGIDYADNDGELIESVSYTARTRYITEVKEIWGSQKPIKVQPLETLTIDCDVSNPIVEVSGYNFVTTAAAGNLITSGVGIVINNVSSKKVNLSIINGNDRLVFLRNFVLEGRLLEPLDNTEYEKSSSASFWSNKTGTEKRISDNPYIQTLAQAKAIADMTLDRQSIFSPKITVKKYRGNFIRVGEMVSVSVVGKFSGNFIVTKSKFNLSKTGFYQDLDLFNASGIYGLQTGGYFIIGTHSGNDNKKLFY